MCFCICAAASQFAALYSLGSFKNTGEFKLLSPHGYIMPSVFTVCGEDMVLCSQIQAWRLQGLSTTSISISCYIQASKQGYERVMELPLAGWFFWTINWILKNKISAPLLYNPFVEINDSEGLWVNRFEGCGEKKAFIIFYYPLFPNKVEGQNHFIEPQAWV